MVPLRLPGKITSVFRKVERVKRLRTSLIGTSRTFRDFRSMSAIVGNSDIERAAPKVRD